LLVNVACAALLLGCSSGAASDERGRGDGEGTTDDAASTGQPGPNQGETRRVEEDPDARVGADDVAADDAYDNPGAQVMASGGDTDSSGDYVFETTKPGADSCSLDGLDIMRCSTDRGAFTLPESGDGLFSRLALD